MRIDSRKAGFGDSWMRLLALATLSKLRPRERHTILVLAPLVPLAERLFQQHFDVSSAGSADIEMHNLGLRTFLPDLLRGRAIYPSFYWALRATRPKTELKDRINDLAMVFASYFTRLSLPKRRYALEYQGFMEMQGLKPFRSVTLDEFTSLMPSVLADVSNRVHEVFPRMTEGTEDVVFPSGTAHQFMSPEVALAKFPKAKFAFHTRDSHAERFTSRGLNVIHFERPEDIFQIMSAARTIYCTDSFPSHLAQTWFNDCYLFMGQSETKTVVVPGFPDERVFHSLAPCHPCRSRARTATNNVCDAGEFYCKTWSVPGYFDQTDVFRVRP